MYVTSFDVETVRHHRTQSERQVRSAYRRAPAADRLDLEPARGGITEDHLDARAGDQLVVDRDLNLCAAPCDFSARGSTYVGRAERHPP